MCGICGFVTKRKIPLVKLKQMNDTMVHRGPNDSGEEIIESLNGYNVGMAHRRLSVIDLSERGHQPMWANSEKVVIVFNGEIYNFLDIKKELFDYSFKSDSDTEIILAAYLKWGEKIVNKLQGMFAIAIFDLRSNKLLLIRDHVGKKPLYLYRKENEIYFASELKPLLTLEWIDKTVNQSVLARYLFQQYINAPESIFKYVYKIEPGTIVTISLEGELQINYRKFWDVNSAFQKYKSYPINDFSEAKKELEKRLIEAVRKRLVSDVSIGCLLSGGIDSSLIAALAQKVLDEPLKTFTIGFAEREYNEAVYSKEIAKYLGTDHTELYMSHDEILKQIESIPTYYDEPFADSSQIPSMLVASLVKPYATVCLTGDGGDELFGGYGVYDRVRLAQQFKTIGNLAYRLGKTPIIGNALTDLYPTKVRKIVFNQDKETESQLNPDVLLSNAYRMINEEHALDCQYPWESKYQEKDWVMRHMLLDVETLLPGDMLCKVDRASMKYSVEMRNPLLDLNVVEYSFRIPQRYKYCNGKKKYIIKELAYDLIPKQLLNRPKKGFSVPLENWMKGPLRESIRAYADTEFLDRQGIFDPKFANMFVNSYLDNRLEKHVQDNNNERIIWSFYVFQQWHQMYIEGGSK